MSDRPAVSSIPGPSSASPLPDAESGIYTWNGDYGKVVIGPSYAEGDRRDLGAAMYWLLDNCNISMRYLLHRLAKKK